VLRRHYKERSDVLKKLGVVAFSFSMNRHASPNLLDSSSAGVIGMRCRNFLFESITNSTVSSESLEDRFHEEVSRVMCLCRHRVF